MHLIVSRRDHLFRLFQISVIELPSNENNEELLKIRHSTAHVMAMAVQQVHPEAKVTIGPWIDNG